MNYYRLLIEQLEDGHGLDEEALRRLLSPIQTALRGIQTRIDSLPDPPAGDEDALEMYSWQFEDLSEEIEDLLGTAFVLCQRRITRVVGLLRLLHGRVEKHAGKKLTSIPSRRQGMLATASARLPGTTITQMQVIEGFANYFKHEDEWPTVGWEELKWQDKNKTKPSKEKDTIESITAAGATSGSTGNFRAGARALGAPTYEVDVLIDILTTLSLPRFCGHTR